jgi:excisionase family DNA binding protein
MTRQNSDEQPHAVTDIGQLLLTTVEAARVLHVGRTTVYELINAGSLRPVHIGRSCRISRAELERYVDGLDGSPKKEPPASNGASKSGRRRSGRAVIPSGQAGLYDLNGLGPDGDSAA